MGSTRTRRIFLLASALCGLSFMLMAVAAAQASEAPTLSEKGSCFLQEVILNQTVGNGDAVLYFGISGPQGFGSQDP